MGVLHMMELPRNLRRRHPQESKALNALVERELQRLDMLAHMAPLRRQLAKVCVACKHLTCLSPAEHPSLNCLVVLALSCRLWGVVSGTRAVCHQMAARNMSGS